MAEVDRREEKADEGKKFLVAAKFSESESKESSPRFFNIGKSLFSLVRALAPAFEAAIEAS